MTPQPSVLELDVVRAQRRVQDFVALAKPRVVTMVLITTAVGFYLASRGAPDVFLLLRALIGTALAAAGTLALNQYTERDTDALMERTRLRPLPDGRLHAGEALVFGIIVAMAGLLYLAFVVDASSGLVTAAITTSYLFFYTPLKRKTPLCSVVGAVSGALPPVTGWVATHNGFGMGAWILFAIMFLWQLPHTLAIAHLYREDYARAGMRLLPVVEPDAKRAARYIVGTCLVLFVVALLPTVVGLAGAVYFATALVFGVGFLGCGLAFARARTAASARQLMFASLLYLPALLIVMALDKIPF